MPGQGNYDTSAQSSGTGVPSGGLAFAVATPSGGFPAAIGSAPTALSWTAPNDGRQHYVEVSATKVVTIQEAGGGWDTMLTAPDGVTTGFPGLFSAGEAPGYSYSRSFVNAVIAPGSTFSIFQSTPLTSGASKLWAAIFAS